MLNYMMIFRDDRCQIEQLSPEKRESMVEDFIAWADQLAADGKYQYSDRLATNGEAKTLRKRGQTINIEGPFAETHEAINGFIVIEVATEEEALAAAEECPGLALGWAVEVRRIVPVAKPSS